jgi:hypothetical protein
MNNSKSTLEDTLNSFGECLKENINCIKVGKILKFYPETKTADIKLYLTKQQPDGILVKTPILPKVRIWGNTITLPIIEGEDCLVFFNDFSIEKWWINGDNGLPEDERKHDLADTFALTGFNGLYNKLANYDNEHISLNHNTKINGTLDAAGNITSTAKIKGAELIADNGATGAFTDTGSGASGKTLTITNGIITGIQ